MKSTILISCLSVLIIPFTMNSQSDRHSLIKAPVNIEKLADGFKFTEGPAVDKAGNVYFTDQPNDRIWIWTVEGSLELFSEDTGRANGLYFDSDGNLLACSDMHNEIRSFDMDGNHTVLVGDYENKLLNGPNDLWVHPNGGIYFTDPLYKRDYWTRDPEMQQDGQHVYYLTPDRQTVKRVDTNLTQPNGIVGTLNGELLYVADIGARKTYAYDIQPDGSLANKRLFVEMGSDGMTLDEAGNLYLTGHGVMVYNPEGEQILHLAVDAEWTSNVCFGGRDMQTLFITASECLYSQRMKLKGIR